MQVQDSYTVPRRPLDVEDYIDVARRHASWILGPLFAGIVIAVVGAFLWPDTYVSTATIKVTPQQVPESYVQSNVNQMMSDRIASITQTVISRPVLTGIITTNDLYPRERQRLPMDDVVEKMRGDIKVSGVTNVTSSRERVPAFQIQFSYSGDRHKAQKVVSEIVSKFIDTNQRERTASSIGTTNLLRDEWEMARKELDQIESKLAAFRSKNQGHLPDEMQANLQQINVLQTRMSTLNSSLSRLNQEKLMLETQLKILKDQLTTLTKEPATSEAAAAQKSERLAEAEREVRYYENQLIALREHYKETYPDVQRAQAMLAAAKKKRDDASKDESAAKPAAATASRQQNPAAAREAREVEANIRRLQSLIEAKDLEGDQYRKELSQADAAMKNYQSRLQGTPLSEKEFAEISRDRDLARFKFAELDQKMNKAMLAQNMENRKAGENLELLDTASLPETPTQPKRPLVIAAGAALGFFSGLLLAGAREVKDTSLKNLKDVRAYTRLPILGTVPLLENDTIVKRRRRFAWFAWSLACLTGVALMSGSVLYYYATRV